MKDFLGFVLFIGGIALPFIAMPLLWRRMKRVRDQSYRESRRQARAEPWQEPLSTDKGLSLGRQSNINDDLIDLGNRASQTRWPIDNP